MLKSTAMEKMIALYNTLFCEENLHRFQRFVVMAAGIAFLLHLGAILLNNVWMGSPEWLAGLGTNYLSAIFTPFAVILTFEVYLLIAAIPQTMTLSIVRQYEVISLIVLWGVFKDASNFNGVVQIGDQSDVLSTVALDIGAAIVLFALVALFIFTSKVCPRDEDMFITTQAQETFVKTKKVIALALTGVLIFLGFFYLLQWFMGFLQGSSVSLFDVQDTFFGALFTVMIFTDIVIVLLSYAFLEGYEIVYRNAMFIISTIFIRFSLTADQPLNLALAIGALVIGNLVNIVYIFYSKLDKKPNINK